MSAMPPKAVDTNGLPVHRVRTPGEEHDTRLCSFLLSPFSRIVDTTRTG
jgi:hypothetical protein